MKTENWSKSGAKLKWPLHLWNLFRSHFLWIWPKVPYKGPLKKNQGSPSATYVHVAISWWSRGHFCGISWNLDPYGQNGVIFSATRHKIGLWPDFHPKACFTSWTENSAIRSLLGVQWSNFRRILPKLVALTCTWSLCTRWPLKSKMAATILCKRNGGHLGFQGSPSAKWPIGGQRGRFCEYSPKSHLTVLPTVTEWRHFPSTM